MGISGDYDFWFTKINDKGDALPGALFALYISLDFTIGAERLVYSGTDGVVAFRNLPVGTYFVQETFTPSGFIEDLTIYKVVLTQTGFEIYYGDNFEKKLSDNDNKIINKPERPQPEPVSVILTGRKNLIGKSLTKNMFNFAVKGRNGEIIATGINDAGGNVIFSGIEFDTTGIYAFTVEELRGVYSEITYDTSKYAVIVTVTDGGSGQLTANVSYPDGNVVFNNEYAAAPVKKCICPVRTTKCRRTIEGKKIWIDNNNADNTRPQSVEIILLRDGENYKRISLDTAEGNEVFTFCCLPIMNNAGHEYNYQIDEANVPEDYTKTIEKYNVINKLKLKIE